MGSQNADKAKLYANADKAKLSSIVSLEGRNGKWEVVNGKSLQQQNH